jgi:RsiW-degrading membrane proteinase PrsW (M82 family)
LIDKAAGIYSVFYSLGCIFAVVFANILYLYVSKIQPDNFPITCDIIAFICLGFSLLFFGVNGVYRQLFSKPSKDIDPVYDEIIREVMKKMS